MHQRPEPGKQVAVVHPDALDRATLAYALRGDAHIAVVAAEPTVDAVRQQFGSGLLDVLLMWVDPTKDLSLAALAVESVRPTRVIGLVDSDEPERLLQLLKVGICGWVCSPFSWNAVLEAVNRVSPSGRNALPMTRRLAQLVRGELARLPESHPGRHLGVHEREALDAVAEGVPEKEIAERLFVKSSHIEEYLFRMARNLSLPLSARLDEPIQI